MNGVEAPLRLSVNCRRQKERGMKGDSHVAADEAAMSRRRRHHRRRRVVASP